jgi:hypothetical protein
VLGVVVVAQVEGVHREAGAGEGLEPGQHGWPRVAEVVDDHHVVAGLDELDDGVGADVAGSAADEDLHAQHPSEGRMT